MAHIWPLPDSSTIQWEPDFDPKPASINTVAAWLRIRIPHCPMEYYDEESLSFIGNSLGRTIKVDLKTATQARGLFARICHQLNQYFGRTQTPIAGRSLTTPGHSMPSRFAFWVTLTRRLFTLTLGISMPSMIINEYLLFVKWSYRRRTQWSEL